MLVVSHDDLDHAGGAGSVARLLPVQRRVASGRVLDPLGAVEWQAMAASCDLPICDRDVFHGRGVTRAIEHARAANQNLPVRMHEVIFCRTSPVDR